MWDKLKELEVGNGRLAIIPVAHTDSEFVETLIFVFKGYSDQNLKFHYVVRNKFQRYPIEPKIRKNGKKEFDRAFIISQFLIFDKIVFEKGDCDLLDQFKAIVETNANSLKNVYCEYRVSYTIYFDVTEVWIGGNLMATNYQYNSTGYDYEYLCDDGSGGSGASGYDEVVGRPDVRVIVKPETWEPDNSKTLPCEGSVAINTTIAPTAVGNSLASGTFDVWRYPQNDPPYQHKGLDIAGDVGDPIYAPFDGIVEYTSGDWGTLGKRIHIISVVNGQTIRVILGHCDAVYPADYDKVKAGAIIAKIGKTGNAYNVPFSHVHVGIQEKIGSIWSDFVNPLNYLTTQYDSNWTPTPCTR